MTWLASVALRLRLRLAAEEDMFSDIALGEVATETSLDDIQF